MTTINFDHSDHTYHNREQPNNETKQCTQCGAVKPLTEFLRRTGRRAGRLGRRGTCRTCRRNQGLAEAALPESRTAVLPAGQPAAMNTERPGERDNAGSPAPPAEAAETVSAPAPRKKRRRRRRGGKGAQARQAGAAARQAPAHQANAAPRPASARPMGAGPRHTPPRQTAAVPAAPPPSTPRRDKHDPADASFLKPTAKGFIRMRGKTDNGRRWYQEVDPELAQVLVREGAAVVVNRTTIRRLYSSKEFRKLILTRDNYTCYFCGKYGDTIDHKLPRAKGGHTTPVNCVCACYECNQLKANRDMDEFMSAFDE